MAKRILARNAEGWGAAETRGAVQRWAPIGSDISFTRKSVAEMLAKLVVRNAMGAPILQR
ncbi:hypothetical protein [Sagittula sp.]|uniref:hypothetical protein n=1 Tax=Sagittula sp. TaxID=2038081 RepID=UPI00405832AA